MAKKIDYSTMERTWHDNPCPNPKLPPLAIELSDIKIPESDRDYENAELAVKGYWRQAVNMTAVDQKEYQQLLNEGFYEVDNNVARKPSNHRLYRACRSRPTWAKFVFIHAIYTKLEALDVHMKPLFVSIEIQDFESHYRKHHPLVVETVNTAKKAKPRKRKTDGAPSGRAAQRQKKDAASSSTTTTATSKPNAVPTTAPVTQASLTATTPVTQASLTATMPATQASLTATTPVTQAMLTAAPATPTARSSPNIPLTYSSSVAGSTTSIYAIAAGRETSPSSIQKSNKIQRAENSATEKRITDAVKNGFTDTNDNIDALFRGLDNLERRQTRSMQMVMKVSQQLKEYDEKVDGYSDDVDDYGDEVAGYSVDVEEYAKKVNECIEQVKKDTEELGDLKQKVDELTTKLDGIESRVASTVASAVTTAVTSALNNAFKNSIQPLGSSNAPPTHQKEVPPVNNNEVVVIEDDQVLRAQEDRGYEALVRGLFDDGDDEEFGADNGGEFEANYAALDVDRMPADTSTNVD